MLSKLKTLRKRVAMGRPGLFTAFLVFLGILFLGQIVLTQTILFFIPGLATYFAQTSFSIGYLSFSILGFIISSVLAFPFLIYFGRETRTAQISGG